jgi:hypothetical protein
LVVAPFVIHDLRQQRLHTEGVRRVAAEMGYVFFPKGDGKTLQELGRFHLFSRGKDKAIRNLVHGTADSVEIKVFDYQHTFGGEDTYEVPRQTVICFRSEELALPNFSLRPRTTFHKVTSALGLDEIAALFGFQDIVIEGRSWFSNYYLLQGDDEGSIRKLFHDRVLSFFEDHAGLCAEGAGGLLILYRVSQRVDPEHLRLFIEEGFKVLALFQ